MTTNAALKRRTTLACYVAQLRRSMKVLGS